MTEKLIEPKATKPKAPTSAALAAATSAAKVFASIRDPEPVVVIVEAPKFVPCRQCGNPGGCARANRCVKGFK